VSEAQQRLSGQQQLLQSKAQAVSLHLQRLLQHADPHSAPLPPAIADHGPDPGADNPNKDAATGAWQQGALSVDAKSARALVAAAAGQEAARTERLTDALADQERALARAVEDAKARKLPFFPPDSSIFVPLASARFGLPTPTPTLSRPANDPSGTHAAVSARASASGPASPGSSRSSRHRADAEVDAKAQPPTPLAEPISTERAHAHEADPRPHPTSGRQRRAGGDNTTTLAHTSARRAVATRSPTPPAARPLSTPPTPATPSILRDRASRQRSPRSHAGTLASAGRGGGLGHNPNNPNNRDCLSSEASDGSPPARDALEDNAAADHSARDARRRLRTSDSTGSVSASDPASSSDLQAEPARRPVGLSPSAHARTRGGRPPRRSSPRHFGLALDSGRASSGASENGVVVGLRSGDGGAHARRRGERQARSDASGDGWVESFWDPLDAAASDAAKSLEQPPGDDEDSRASTTSHAAGVVEDGDFALIDRLISAHYQHSSDEDSKYASPIPSPKGFIGEDAHPNAGLHTSHRHGDARSLRQLNHDLSRLSPIKLDFQPRAGNDPQNAIDRRARAF
jgi:hypothetical protein